MLAVARRCSKLSVYTWHIYDISLDLPKKRLSLSVCVHYLLLLAAESLEGFVYFFLWLHLIDDLYWHCREGCWLKELECGTLLQQFALPCHALDINQFFKWYAAPPPPNDMTMRQVADKLASFVAKNGRQFENITRIRNPGDTLFKYGCAAYFWSTAYALCGVFS